MFPQITSRTIHVTHSMGESQFHLRCYDASMNCVAELIFYNSEDFKALQRKYPDLKVIYSTRETNMYHEALHQDGMTSVQITDTFLATITIDDFVYGPVQLANQEEADKLLKEIDDEDGDMMWEDDAICSKYEAFHGLRP